jgi:hypothetical protein
MNLILLVIAVIVGLGYFLFQVLGRRRQKKQDDNRAESLRQNGKMIDVAFEDCVVKTGQLSVGHVSTLPSGVEMADGLFGKGAKGEEVAQVSYIVYEWRRDGRVLGKFVSQPFFLPEETLRYKMELTKTAKLYVDPNDSSSYLFDIKF